MITRRYEFLDEEQLKDHLLHLNYELGQEPELACIDSNGRVFIASGTDEGDSMGFAYYFTGPEGYMYHYGVEYDGDDVNLKWTPKFPVSALGASDDQA